MVLDPSCQTRSKNPACVSAQSTLSNMWVPCPLEVSLQHHASLEAPAGTPAPSAALLQGPHHTENTCPHRKAQGMTDCQPPPGYKKPLADNDPGHRHQPGWKLMQSLATQHRSLCLLQLLSSPEAAELMSCECLFSNLTDVLLGEVSQRWQPAHVLRVCSSAIISRST